MKIHIHKGHNTKCEECSEILGSVGDLDVHEEKFHDSNLKDLTPAACLCGICDPEEIGNKASTEKEHTKNDALFDGPMLSTRLNGEILPCSVLSMDVYNYIGEGESADVTELPNFIHIV